METFYRSGHVGVSSDRERPFRAEIAVVFEDHHARLQDGHRLEHPIVETVDIEREKIDLARQAMTLDQCIDVFWRDGDGLE